MRLRGSPPPNHYILGPQLPVVTTSYSSGEDAPLKSGTVGHVFQPDRYIYVRVSNWTKQKVSSQPVQWRTLICPLFGERCGPRKQGIALGSTPILSLRAGWLATNRQAIKEGWESTPFPLVWQNR